MKTSSLERRIARDIHDELGQSLVALKFELAALSRSASRSDEGLPSVEVVNRCAVMARSVDDTLASMRRILDNLHPIELDEVGLRPALEAHARKFADRTGIDLELDLDEPPPDLSMPVKHALFRILQEALSNVARHADARRVRVRFESTERWLRLAIADDGRGFDPATRTRPDAFGVAGMRARAAELGGRLEVTSVQGEGSIVEARLPGR